MAIELSTFRALANDSGYIRSNGKDTIKLGGTGVFGKIREWVRSFDKTGNATVKADFLNTLSVAYGPTFLSSPAVKNLIGHDPTDRNSSKPLSARTVRDIIAIGDKKILSETRPELLRKTKPVPERDTQKTLTFPNGAKTVTVTSSHASQADIKASAQRFIDSNNINNGTSDLLRSLINYINSKDEDEPTALKQLAQHSGSASTLSFAKAFKIKDETTKLPSMDLSAVDPGSQDPQKMRTIQSAAGLCALQISSRMKMMADAVLTAKDPNRASYAANEVLEKTSAQIKTLSEALDLISDSTVIDHGRLSPEAALDFVTLKTTIESQLSVLRDPNGIFQSFIAFAADVAIHPEEGYKTIQAMHAR